jgi:tight adherence protein C
MDLAIACGAIFIGISTLTGWAAWMVQRRRQSPEAAAAPIKVKRLALDHARRRRTRGRLGTKLMRAGYRGAGWIPVVYITQGLAVLAGVCVGVWGYQQGVSAPVLVGASLGIPVVGLLVPEWWLSMRMKERSREMNRYLIDMLDLLVICLEAGLSFNASLIRVVGELQWTSLVLSEELQFTNHEIQMGRTRAEALRNLGERVGSDDFNGLLAVLIQAEKFGMSMAKTLRTQVESMRQKRRQKIQQAIHTIPVKMLFPMVSCIFPQLLMIILGPACIKVWGYFKEANAAR